MTADRQEIIAVLDLHLVGQVLPENWQSYREALADALMALPDVDSKQLAETATELGRRLGRKEAGEEIAEALEAYIPDPHPGEEYCPDCDLIRDLARLARGIGDGDPT